MLVLDAIPADRSTPAWRAGIFVLLDRWAAELRRFPSLWRSALRSDDTEADWSEVASVDPTEARSVSGFGPADCVGRRPLLIGFYPE
jgi:hypothetical protein